MSDAAVATIAAAAITIATMVVGFLTLWIKLKYGVQKAEEASTKAGEASASAGEAADKVKVVEGKLDDNTAATKRIEKQTNGPLDKRFSQLEDHALRIAALEVKVEAIKVSLEGLGQNITSTRHELRGHLQTIMGSLQLLSVNRPVPPVVPTPPAPPCP